MDGTVDIVSIEYVDGAIVTHVDPTLESHVFLSFSLVGPYQSIGDAYALQWGFMGFFTSSSNWRASPHGHGFASVFVCGGQGTHVGKEINLSLSTLSCHSIIFWNYSVLLLHLLR